jgi:hypothetical protein
MARCSVFGGCLAPTTLLLVVLTLLVSSTVAGMLHFCQYVLRSIDDCFRFVNLFLKLQRCDLGVTADFWFLVLASRVEAFTMTLLATCWSFGVKWTFSRPCTYCSHLFCSINPLGLHTLSVCSWIDFLFAISTSLIMYLLSTMSQKHLFDDVEAWVSQWLQSMPWTRRKRWSELVELYCRLLLQVCIIHSSSFLAVCFFRHPFEVLLWQVHEWQQNGIYH